MFHIFPINDEQEHDLESTLCLCSPSIDWELSLVVHHAFDHREIVEEAQQILDAFNTAD